jgi:16S rRNA (uracil1498-N3)-methyltransferase
VPGEHTAGQVLQLDAERSNYACKALRLTTGDALDIFNGLGGLYRCELVEAHQRRAKVRVGEPVPVPSPSGLAPSVAIGLLKGQAMDRAIQQATELGARNIWLLQAQRSNVSLKDGRLSQKLEHWRRSALDACPARSHLPFTESRATL